MIILPVLERRLRLYSYLPRRSCAEVGAKREGRLSGGGYSPGRP